MLNSYKNILKFYKGNLLLEVFLFLSIAFIVNLYFQIQRNKLANQEVCKIIAENYLDGLSESNFKNCNKIISHMDFSNTSKINKLNYWLKSFYISHLYIYNSKENKKMWQGESRETGIVVKKIFDKWRVTQVLVSKSFI